MKKLNGLLIADLMLDLSSFFLLRCADFFLYCSSFFLYFVHELLFLFKAEIVCSELETFSTLCTVVTQAGLNPALDTNATTWTIFAPNNDAFSYLSQEMQGSLLSDMNRLVSILLFHAIPGRVLYEQDLRCSRRIEMANGDDSRHVCLGDDLYQKGSGNPRDNMPKIVDTDIGACNGVIHVIDDVMLPPM